MSMMPGQGPAMAPPGAPPPMMGLPPAAPTGAPFPSLDPASMAGLVAPIAQLQAADQQRLAAQQQATVSSLIDMMNNQPSPAAQAAMVEPGAPTSPLADANVSPDTAGL
jgi:hypothetical protein